MPLEALWVGTDAVAAIGYGDTPHKTDQFNKHGRGCFSKIKVDCRSFIREFTCRSIENTTNSAGSMGVVR